MYIEDDELRTLFETASEEHLQKLEAGLLQLEKQPDDADNLEELLREAHSLKGDARMLGVNDVEKITHQIEHILGTVSRQETQLTPELSDRLYQGLDIIRQLVHEAVTGEPSGVDAFHALANLMGATASPEQESEAPAEAPEATETPPETSEDLEPDSEAPEPSPEDTPEPVTEDSEPSPEDTPEPVTEDSEPSPEDTPEPVTEDSEPSPEDSEPVTEETPDEDSDATESPTPRQPQPKDGQTVTISTPTPTSSTSPQGEPYRIHTIRVETRYLDDLITQSGELTVTKIRIAHVANEINTLYDLWEEAKNHQNGHQNGNGQINHNLNEQIEDLLDQLKLSAQENTSRLDLIAGNLENRIRTLRLLPLSNIFQLFPRMVRDLSRQEGKTVELIIEGADTTADKRILEEMKDPLMHLIRNAIDHGIEPPEQRQKAGKDPTATIWLRGYQTTSNIIIEVADDGRGLNENQIKKTAIKRGLYRPEELESFTPNQIYNLIFLPGFSTQGFITEVSGRGVGLDVVYHNVEQLKGSIQVESTPGQGSTFRIQLGTTLATANVLLVSVQGITQAIPIEYVETSFLINPDDVFTIEGRETVAVEGKAISVAHLGDLLELGSPHGETPNHEDGQGLPCVLLNVGEDRFGVFVDELLDTQDVVLKPQSELLKRVRNVAGATILGTGEVCMILNPVDLLKSVQKGTMGGVATTKTVGKKAQKPSILLAEDSITIRTQEKRILEGAGYEVVTAVDGLDGWTKLRSRSFDAVVTDIQMPNLDGLALTERIRQQAEYNELPIILVTSLSSDEDRRRGVEAGANAYITKGAFNQDILLETLRRLV